MFKKVLAGLAAIGLASCTATAPAYAQPQFSIGIQLGNHYRPYTGDYDYRYNARCHPREILVQDRRGRIFCVSKREYKRYQRESRYYNDDNRYDNRRWERGY